MVALGCATILLIASRALSGESVACQASLVVLGDSLSSGFGLKNGEGWVETLSERLAEFRVNTINVSRPNLSTFEALKALRSLTLKARPTIVLLAVGSVDGLSTVPTVTIRGNLTRALLEIRAMGAEPVLMTLRLPIHPDEGYANEFERSFESVSSINNVHSLSWFLSDIPGEPVYWLNDGIHPTALSQRLIFERVWSELTPVVRQLLKTAGIPEQAQAEVRPVGNKGGPSAAARCEPPAPSLP